MARSSAAKSKGFTLVELILIMGLIAALVAAAVVGLIRHRQEAEDKRMEAELTSIYKAIQSYQMIYGRYPRTYGELSEFIEIPNFNARYDLNPNP